MPPMNVPSSTASETADEPRTSCSSWNQTISYISAAQPLPTNSARTSGNQRSAVGAREDVPAGAALAPARARRRARRTAPTMAMATASRISSGPTARTGAAAGTPFSFGGAGCTVSGASSTRIAAGNGEGGAQ